MKCGAKRALNDQRTLKVTRIYGVHCLEAIQAKAALLILENYPWFRRPGNVGRRPGSKNPVEADRMREFFDGQAAYCARELNENAAETVYITDRRLGRHEADRDERFEEICSDAEYRLTRLLSDGGIDTETVYSEAEARLPEGVRLGAQAVARDARVAWYAWLGRRAVRIWIAAACLSLLDFRFGCGRRRFAIASVERDFAIPLAAFASEWLERFFGGTDHSMADEQAARMRILRERYNVDLRPVDPDRDNAAEVLRLGLAPEDKPPVKRDVPEEYARILDEVQRGRGTGIFPGGGK